MLPRTSKSAPARGAMGSAVQPNDHCAHFEKRRCIACPREECWYCRHADFGLDKDKPDETGKCCWPEVKIF